MDNFNTYKVDYFLLGEDFREPGVEYSRISYVVRGGDTQAEHEAYVEAFCQKLLDEHDEEYTSWVATCRRYKCLSGCDPHVTVLHFRVRDAY